MSDLKECPKCGDIRLLEGLPRLYCGSCDWQEEDETAALRQRVAVLEEALTVVFDAMDNGMLIRNTAGDIKPSWVMPWFDFVHRLAKAKELIDNATTEGE